MTIRLTDEQSRCVEAASSEPTRAAVGDREYVLVRAEFYDQVKALLEAEEIDASFYEFDETTNP